MESMTSSELILIILIILIAALAVIIYAIKPSEERAVKAVIEDDKDAPLDKRPEKNKSEVKQLLNAIKNNDTSAIKRYVDLGLPLNFGSCDETTPIWVAYNHNPAVIELLTHYRVK